MLTTDRRTKAEQIECQIHTAIEQVRPGQHIANDLPLVVFATELSAVYEELFCRLGVDGEKFFDGCMEMATRQFIEKIKRAEG